MTKERKYRILEKIIYVIIFFLIIVIAMIFILGNKIDLFNLIKRNNKESDIANYSDAFNIDNIKSTSLQRQFKENNDGLMVLVNKEKLMDESYIPELAEPNIPLVGRSGEEKNKVNIKMVKDLEAMFNDAKKDGITDLLLNSAYRSYENQKNIYDSELKEKNNTTSKLVAKPGSSEHQTGLAIDLTTKSVNFDVTNDFEKTEAFKWLSNNAYKYGFILRYPKDKEDITKYDYEPWHYRYIGDETLSKYIHENNLALEEISK